MFELLSAIIVTINGDLLILTTWKKIENGMYVIFHYLYTSIRVVTIQEKGYVHIWYQNGFPVSDILAILLQLSFAHKSFACKCINNSKNTSNKEFFNAHTHGNIEKSHWPEWEFDSHSGQ